MRKNALFMALYEIAVYFAPFMTAPYIARVLGTYGTGVYSYTYSIASYFVVLTQLGVTLYGKREIATCLNRGDRSKTFWNIWFIETIMFIASTVLYLGFVAVYNTDMKIVFYIQYFTLVGAWLDISWLFFGVEDFKIAVSRNILVKLLSIVAVFVLVKKSTDINLYIFIMALSNLLGVIVMWITVGKYVDFIKVNKHEIKTHLKPMFKLFIPVLSTQLYSLTDKVFLGALCSVDVVGIYENAYKISRVPVALITTLGTVMLPRITKLMTEGREGEIAHYFNKSLSITMFIGTGCAFGLIGIAPTFIPLYLGEGFGDATIILQLLVTILIAIAWGNTFRNQFILPMEMDNLYLKSVIYAAIMNIVLNLIMIPKFSAVGAAMASIIAEFVICVYQSFKIRKFFDLKHLLMKNFKYVFSAIVMLIVLCIYNKLVEIQPMYSLIIQVGLGSLVYISACLLMEVISNEKAITAELVKIYIK